MKGNRQQGGTGGLRRRKKEPICTTDVEKLFGSEEEGKGKFSTTVMMGERNTSSEREGTRLFTQKGKKNLSGNHRKVGFGADFEKRRKRIVYLFDHERNHAACRGGGGGGAVPRPRRGGVREKNRDGTRMGVSRARGREKSRFLEA